MGGERVTRHWIGGEWREDGANKPSIDPATGQTFGSFCDGDETVAQATVQAARSAFEISGWRDDAMLRAATLHRLADAYESICPS